METFLWFWQCPDILTRYDTQPLVIEQINQFVAILTSANEIPVSSSWTDSTSTEAKYFRGRLQAFTRMLDWILQKNKKKALKSDKEIKQEEQGVRNAKRK
jgi:hypothetical protein